MSRALVTAIISAHLALVGCGDREGREETAPARKPPPVDPGAGEAVPPDGATPAGAGEDALLPAPTDAQIAAFTGSPEEPAPKKRADDRHYVHSNEHGLGLFVPYIEGAGGGYVGIGSDQNYTLAARARSEWVWLVDYDIVVVRMHRIVRALVLASPDAASYRALWEPEAEEQALALVEEMYADDGELADLKKTFHKWRGKIRAYNERIGGLASEGRCAFWLEDEGSYDHIRALFRAGRIRALRGDLTAGTAVRGIGAAAREMGTTIRVVYLSDAEGFFMYRDAFAENVASLPMDGRSVVLRTVQAEVFDVQRADFMWHYNVQAGTHFVETLRGDPPVRKVAGMLALAEPTGVPGVTVIGLGD